MFTSSLLQSAAWLLLLGTASAAPPSGLYADQKDAQATAAWVTVDAEGIPKTITPVLTTIDGTPTVISAAPYDARATGVAADPELTGEKGGSFSACHNTDGAFKPFCLPKHRDVYYPETTHYITWDPSFFGANATIKILGFYVPSKKPNPDDEDPSSPSDDDEYNHPPTPPPTSPLDGPPSGEEEAFSSDTLPAGWGFYQWRLEKSLLESRDLPAANITLHIVALPKDGHARWHTGPTITLKWKERAKKPAKINEAHETQALWVALPLVFGFATFMVIGTFVYNRQLRAIGLGAVAKKAIGGRIIGGGRKRGGTGVGAGIIGRKDRAQDAEQSIRLMGRDGVESESEGEAWGEEGVRRGAGRKRD